MTYVAREDDRPSSSVTVATAEAVVKPPAAGQDRIGTGRPAGRGRLSSGGARDRHSTEDLRWILITALATLVTALIPLFWRPRFYFRGDTEIGAMGQWFHFGRSLLRGEWALLDPQAWAGGNYIAEGQGGLFSPLTMLIAVLAATVGSFSRLRNCSQTHPAGRRRCGYVPAYSLVRRLEPIGVRGRRGRGRRRRHAVPRITLLGNGNDGLGALASGLVGDTTDHDPERQSVLGVRGELPDCHRWLCLRDNLSRSGDRGLPTRRLAGGESARCSSRTCTWRLGGPGGGNGVPARRPDGVGHHSRRLGRRQQREIPSRPFRTGCVRVANRALSGL